MTAIRKLNNVDTQISMGYAPPSATDVEEAVLGAIMLEKGALSQVIEFLMPDDFFKTEHIEIYEAILSLDKQNAPIDLLTVCNELRKTKKIDLVGGAYYLSELTNRVGGAANLEYHAMIVCEKSMERKVMELSIKKYQSVLSGDSDVFSEINELELQINQIKDRFSKTSNTSIAFALSEANKEVKEAANNTTGIIGVDCGYRLINEALHGLQHSCFYILAARPGVGKTALALNMISHIARNGLSVGFFSLEMPKEQLVKRLISSLSGISHKRVTKGEIYDYEKDSYNKAHQTIKKMKVFINDTGGLEFLSLKHFAKQMHEKGGINLLVIDYVQLIKYTDKVKRLNREQEISEISRGLKALSKELKIPILALAQVSREADKYKAGRPTLSTLRESGQLEADADGVLFLYNPEKNGVLEDSNGTPTAGMIEVMIEKNRHGATTFVNEIMLLFNAKIQKFSEVNANDVPDNFKSIVLNKDKEEDIIEVPF